MDIDGVQVASMTADEFQSQTTNHGDGSVTLSLPLTQRLSENATTVILTKFNTVTNNMSDVTGNVVTWLVIWRTLAAFSELCVHDCREVSRQCASGACMHVCVDVCMYDCISR